MMTMSSTATFPNQNGQVDIDRALRRVHGLVPLPGDHELLSSVGIANRGSASSDRILDIEVARIANVERFLPDAVSPSRLATMKADADAAAAELRSLESVQADELAELNRRHGDARRKAASKATSASEAAKVAENANLRLRDFVPGWCRQKAQAITRDINMGIRQPLNTVRSKIGIIKSLLTVKAPPPLLNKFGHRNPRPANSADAFPQFFEAIRKGILDPVDGIDDRIHSDDFFNRLPEIQTTIAARLPALEAEAIELESQLTIASAQASDCLNYYVPTDEGVSTK
jgi:hypothetical protein